MRELRRKGGTDGRAERRRVPPTSHSLLCDKDTKIVMCLGKLLERVALFCKGDELRSTSHELDAAARKERKRAIQF